MKPHHQIQLPPEGLVVSAKLAEVLGARVGDELLVEVLEGKRPVRNVRLVGLAEDFAGMAAYMDMHALEPAAGRRRHHHRRQLPGGCRPPRGVPARA